MNDNNLQQARDYLAAAMKLLEPTAVPLPKPPVASDQEHAPRPANVAEFAVRLVGA